MLTYQTITTLPGWDALKEDWNRLLDKSHLHVPFLRHEFMQDWWAHLGGGEWTSAELGIVTARDGDDLVGIAPLFQTTDHEGRAVLMFIGSFEIVDFIDFLAPPERLEEFLAGLLPYLQATRFSAVERLDLYNILSHSASLPALQKVAADLGWNLTNEVLQPAPYVPLPGDWETYLAGIDKKQRHEIRRKMRRAEESGYQTEVYFTTDRARLDGDIKCFFRLMSQDPDKEKFLTEKMREQMASTIRCAFDHNCLQLAFLEIGGERASVYMSFDYLDRLWVYNSGVNRQLNEYSPGWVLLGYLLKWCNENGRREFDFMRGNEEYKYRFGAVDRFVHKVTLSPHG
jgi:CelD/BcsL family acetyltransferase involved in cellulose biosynthesis